MNAVDVLAVMDRGIADLMEGHCTLWTARDVKAMRAAAAELVERERLMREALHDVLRVQTKDVGYGPERFTSGDGHAQCVEIASAALARAGGGK